MKRVILENGKEADLLWSSKNSEGEEFHVIELEISKFKVPSKFCASILDDKKITKTEIYFGKVYNCKATLDELLEKIEFGERRHRELVEEREYIQENIKSLQSSLPRLKEILNILLPIKGDFVLIDNGTEINIDNIEIKPFPDCQRIRIKFNDSREINFLSNDDEDSIFGIFKKEGIILKKDYIEIKKEEIAKNIKLITKLEEK